MELRLLSSETEREMFERGLTAARVSGGSGRGERGSLRIGFKEKSRSRVGQIHLAYGRLYGLFDEQAPDPDRILGGFAIHALDEFGQSYPKPDLTHFPPESVYEGGELWAATKGAAIAARQGCCVLLGLVEAQALLVYPILKPWNLTFAYRDCKAVGAPIEWPYVETLSGEKFLVQPMILEGDSLRTRTSQAMESGFYAREDLSLIRFNYSLRSSVMPELPTAPPPYIEPAFSSADGMSLSEQAA